ncbi:MAG: methylase involved in ubiquinone/menaquinone biosynthesis [halophilic archaeon J07HX5]|jgi:Methylase involved in ubiquinone/menaquinone biosynthesis|nr:MAG: methylase involved in ubiquinone/menaquinone biosynthesis [halophilic archaeon J07HX5]
MRAERVKGEEWYQADDVAEAYDEKRFSRGGRLIDRREKRAVIDALSPLDNKQILEIACGTGRFTTLLADRGANIVGVDISDPMLQQARERAQMTGVADNLTYFRGDAARLPFDDGQFDAVLAMRFFHLCDTPVEFMTELSRVSRGQVVFDTFNRFSTRSLYNWALPMGSRLYGQQQVSKLLEAAGLELADAEHDWMLPYGFYRKLPTTAASAFRRLETGLDAAPATSYLASVSYWNAQRQPELASNS